VGAVTGHLPPPGTPAPPPENYLSLPSPITVRVMVLWFMLIEDRVRSGVGRTKRSTISVQRCMRCHASAPVSQSQPLGRVM